MLEPLLTSGLAALSELIQIPLWQTDEQGALVRQWYPLEPAYPAAFRHVFFQSAFTQTTTDSPLLIQGADMGRYVCVTNGQNTFWIAGPAFTHPQTTQSHIRPLFLEHSSISIQKDFAKHAPMLSLYKLCNYAALLYSLVTQNVCDAKTLYNVYRERAQTAFNGIDFARFLYGQREDLVAHDGYTRELLLLNCVKNGDYKKLEEMSAQMYHATQDLSTSNTLSNDAKSQILYIFVATTTLVTRFAMEGGLEQETAYSLSDLYIRKAGQCQTQYAIQELLIKMAKDFATRVATSEPPAQYSVPVTLARNYVLTHLHYQISLQDIADACGLTKSYLSTRFKQETGLTISAFILHERIKEAKNLLCFSTLSCQEIGNTLAFSSQSYFSDIFRRETGLTPLQYRNKYYGWFGNNATIRELEK